MLLYRPLPFAQELDRIGHEQSSETAREVACAAMLETAKTRGFQIILYSMRQIEASAYAGLQVTPDSPRHAPAYYAGMAAAVASLRNLIQDHLADPADQQTAKEAFELAEAGLYDELPPADTRGPA